MRPTRPRSASSSSSKRAGEHVEVDRLLDRIQAGQAIQGPLHPFGRLLLGRRPGAPAALRRRADASQMAPGPGGPLRPTAGAASAACVEVVDQVRRRSPAGRGPGRHRSRSRLGPPRRCVRIRLGQRPLRRLARRRRWSSGGPSRSRPATTPASRDRRSQAVDRDRVVPRGEACPRPARRRRPHAGIPAREAPEGPSRVRPTTRAVSGMTAAPFRAMPAAASCSWANRA